MGYTKEENAAAVLPQAALYWRIFSGPPEKQHCARKGSLKAL